MKCSCKPVANPNSVRLTGIEGSLISINRNIDLIYGRLTNLSDINLVHTINNESINGIKTIIGSLFSVTPIKYMTDISTSDSFDDRSLVDKGYVTSQTHATFSNIGFTI